MAYSGHSKYSCGLIRDLLPLYCDGVCGKDSAQAVQEHLDTCGACRQLYGKMKQDAAPETSETLEMLEQRQIDSMRKVKKRIRKENGIFGIVGVLAGGLIAAFILWICLFAGALSLLPLISLKAQIEVHEGEEIARYRDYIGEDAVKPYHRKNGMDETVFPQINPENMEVKEFKFVYYDPWDAQYVAYLTVEYTQDAYAEELARLSEKGTDEFIGYYSVTAEPEGYTLLAMNADSYSGFVYAITPKKEGTTTVTYVMIVFCNYFLDLDIHEYMPNEYLLQGFDADVKNPYREKMLHR